MTDLAFSRPALSDRRLRQLADQFDAEPAYRHVGLALDSLARGYCQASLDIAPALLHHRDAVQGGIVAMVADATAGYAALTILDETAGEDRDDMATLEFKTSFLLPAQGQALRCEARILHASRSIVFCDAQVHVLAMGESRLCAQATLTFKRLHARR